MRDRSTRGSRYGGEEAGRGVHFLARITGRFSEDALYLVIPMIREKRQYLQMNRLSLRNNRFKFKNAGIRPIVLEEFLEYTPI
jgi:hypothetical protein